MVLMGIPVGPPFSIRETTLENQIALSRNTIDKRSLQKKFTWQVAQSRTIHAQKIRFALKKASKRIKQKSSK